MSINLEELREEVAARIEEPLGPSDQEIDEALDNIEANDEADPTPLVISADAIPDGMTPTEVTEVWTQTGNTIITSTDAVDGSLNPGATYRAQFAVNFRGDQGVVLDDVTITPVKKKRAIAKAKQDRIKEEEEKLKKRADAKKRRERRSILLNTSYVLQSNDLMILVSGNGDIEMIKTDTQHTGTVKDLHSKVTPMCPDTGIVLPLLNNELLFDKNMNPLTINYFPFNKEKSTKGTSRIDPRNLNIAYYTHPAAKKRWIIVDKKAFIESNGKKFKIKHRVGFSMLDVLKIKRKINNRVKEAELFIEHIKTLISGIYDEQHYEIIYVLDFTAGNHISQFHIFLQFPDLVVSNSIEMTHTIDNLITKMTGEHYMSKKVENTYRIFRGLAGIRTIFTPKDAYYGYNHSHLSSGSRTWGNFCMGDKHFMSGLSKLNGNTADIEFEMILIGVLDHISWESLEGGPYIKMENIGESRGEPLAELEFTKILKIHSCGAIRKIFRLLKQKNLTPLMKAFTLKMQSNKEVTYVLDKHIFIEHFLKIFSEDSIELINREYDISTYKYIPFQQQFVAGGRRRRPNDWEDIVYNARAKVCKFPITYMNGKYIRPQVIKTDNPDIIAENEIVTFHPKIIFYVANIIHYHLLNELKNVK